MAHNLNQAPNGKMALMYCGEVPWHGLGTRLNGPATSAEALTEAQLDWDVLKVPLWAGVGMTSYPVPRHHALVRSDLWGTSRCPILGVVGDGYEPLQNAEAFRFFDEIVGSKEAIYHTAGALGQGERIWLLAKLPKSDFEVVPGDKVEPYLLLVNGHDGHTPIQIKLTTVRVVCQNTVIRALEQGPTQRVHHGEGMRQRLWGAAKLLGVVQQEIAGYQQSSQAMAKYPMNPAKLASYLNAIFPDPQRKPDQPPDRQSPLLEVMHRHRARSAYYYDCGRGNHLPNVRGTLWAALNGVTEYVDHELTSDKSPDDRFRAVLYGRGQLIKQKAYKQAEALVTQGVN